MNNLKLLNLYLDEEFSVFFSDYSEMDMNQIVEDLVSEIRQKEDAPERSIKFTNYPEER